MFASPPTLLDLHVALRDICAEIVAQVEEEEGESCVIFNFLLCVGEFTQFAYCYPGTRPGSTVYNGLHYIIRKHPFHVAALSDADVTVNFESVTTENDRVAIIATKPLTKDEDWIEMARGDLLLFHLGEVYELPACDREEEGRDGERERDKEICDASQLREEKVLPGSSFCCMKEEKRLLRKGGEL